jgi:hypothetical protein
MVGNDSDGSGALYAACIFCCDACIEAITVENPSCMDFDGVETASPMVA